MYVRFWTSDQQTPAMQWCALREYVSRSGWAIARRVREAGAAQRQAHEQPDANDANSRINRRNTRNAKHIACSRPISFLTASLRGQLQENHRAPSPAPISSLVVGRH
jgi:hypothetical protein